MKLPLILLALGLVLGANSAVLRINSEKDLNSDFDDFLALVPLGEWFDIFIDYLFDAEFQQVVTYMFSQRFADIIEEIDTIQEFRDLVDYIDDAGIGLRGFLDNLKEILNITPQPELKSPRAQDLGGMYGLLVALKKTIPWDDVYELHADKMENSPEWQEMIEKLSSDEFKALNKALEEHERFQELWNELSDAGVDISGLIRICREFLGLIPGPRKLM